MCPSDDLSARLPELDTNQVQTLPACTGATGGLSYTFTQNGPGNSGQNRPGAPTAAPGTTSATPAPPSAAESR